MSFWFSYTMIAGRLVIMDVTETHARGVRCFTAAWSEDPRVCVMDLSPDAAVAKLVAHLEAHLARPAVRVTFLPQHVAVPA